MTFTDTAPALALLRTCTFPPGRPSYSILHISASPGIRSGSLVQIVMQISLTALLLISVVQSGRSAWGQPLKQTWGWWLIGGGCLALACTRWIQPQLWWIGAIMVGAGSTGAASSWRGPLNIWLVRLLDAITLGGFAAVVSASIWQRPDWLLSGIVLLWVPVTRTILEQPQRARAAWLLAAGLVLAGGRVLAAVEQPLLAGLLALTASAALICAAWPHRAPTLPAWAGRPLYQLVRVLDRMAPYAAWIFLHPTFSSRPVQLLWGTGLLGRIMIEQLRRQKIAQALRNSIQQESQVRALLAGNAHNIKHPLTNLRSHLSQLETIPHRTPAQAQLLLQAALPALQENISLLGERISQMLDIAQRAVIPIICHSIRMGDLQAVLEALIMREQRTSIPPLQASVRCDQPDIYVWTDSAAVVWCVENLIRNTIQAQRDQPAAIVTLRLSAHGTTRLIAVEDAGPGFPSSVLTTGHAVSTTQVAGHGLGLIGVKETLRQLGASLRIANRQPPATGAVVTIVLPHRSQGEHRNDRT